jgi:hypothetical protein
MEKTTGTFLMLSVDQGFVEETTGTFLMEETTGTFLMLRVDQGIGAIPVENRCQLSFGLGNLLQE